MLSVRTYMRKVFHMTDISVKQCDLIAHVFNDPIKLTSSELTGEELSELVDMNIVSITPSAMIMLCHPWKVYLSSPEVVMKALK